MHVVFGPCHASSGSFPGGVRRCSLKPHPHGWMGWACYRCPMTIFLQVSLERLPEGLLYCLCLPIRWGRCGTQSGAVAANMGPPFKNSPPANAKFALPGLRRWILRYLTLPRYWATLRGFLISPRHLILGGLDSKHCDMLLDL
jgi:hypothetical protein